MLILYFNKDKEDKMDKIWNCIFKFTPTFNSRFELDGTFYTLLSTKPSLKPIEYTAKYLNKENGSIHAVIVGKNGHPVIRTVIEVR